MSEALYNQAILRLASAVPHGAPLSDADARVERVSAICGSRVRAAVRLDARGCVAAFAQEVRACALGQASAAVLGARVIGLDEGALAAARDGLAAYLRGVADAPPWPELEVFAPVRAYRARQASVMLAVEAAAAAAAAADAAATVGRAVAA